MAVSVLITQCLQRDFVGLTKPYDPLPNRLHVGYAEALRLLGEDPGAGPVAQMMNWARSQPADTLEIVHIRDWHDRDDPRQRDHLRMFGDHCIQHTPGAELVLESDEKSSARTNVHLVDSIALNDFEDTTLSSVLNGIVARANGAPLRVGAIGVWTEAKISFLLYDLKTRMGIHELATCSALTASASRAQHFNALEQLNRILGVQCFASVGDFIKWLAPGSEVPLPPVQKRFGHNIETVGGGAKLSMADEDIVTYLYRDSSRVSLEPLSGGFSGNFVFRASCRGAFDLQQAASVVKLGPSGAIAAERVAFERIEEILGNNAPTVRGFADLNGRAGIKYSFAGMGPGKVRTFKALFESGCDAAKIETVLRAVFEEILAPFYAAAHYERLPLLEHYGFSAKYANDVAQNVERVIQAGMAMGTVTPIPVSAGSNSRGRLLAFRERYVVENVSTFYSSFLAAEPQNSGEFHYVSYVHGDLNGANILIDGHDNVWIIDFFHTARGHVLKDLAKLENDILYIFTPIRDVGALDEALIITRVLRNITDLRQPLPESLPGVKSDPLMRAWRTLKALREMGGKICRDDRHPLQLQIALLRFAAHTLAFEESSPLQKQWALAASCGWAEEITATLRRDKILRLDWAEVHDLVQPSNGVAAGKIGMTICPGRKDRGRALDADLDVMVQNKVSRLLCLVTGSELEWAGISAIGSETAARGIEFKQHAIPDGGTTDLASAAQLAEWLLSAVRRGENVVVHCMGGLGRTGTIAACALVVCGASATDAILRVRASRDIRAIETSEQEAFVHAFEKSRN